MESFGNFLTLLLVVDFDLEVDVGTGGSVEWSLGGRAPLHDGELQVRTLQLKETGRGEGECRYATYKNLLFFPQTAGRTQVSAASKW